MAEQQK